MPDIIIVTTPISQAELKKIAEQRFGDLVKGVIDIKTGVLALGGELHADQESLLLSRGSQQENLWGINIYVDEVFPDNIEFDSMINIRPSQNNRSRGVDNPEIRQRIMKLLEGYLT
jgi:hypothetical protein